MGKKSRTPVGTAGVALAESAADVPVVAGRVPCPCGSGKRYKACHGRAQRAEAVRLVARPFDRLPGEPDWVALREIVPAATAKVRTTSEYGARDVTVATVLPMAWPAMRRADGSVLVGLQTQGGSGDAGRDVASALLAALDADPGTPVAFAELPGPGPRVQDVLDPDVPFDVEVHAGFDFWLTGVEDVTPEVRESMERANAAVVPTARLSAVDAAYWCRIGPRRHLRWVLPQPEEELLDALARLHAADSSAIVDGSRFVGAFRADGLLVPVWDLAPDTGAADLEEPAAAWERLLDEALAETSPLSPAERRARAGVVGRQLTLR
jgi:uncharacterized protein DUF5926/SEC-C motif-containing protein